jgi:hypothetical protein
MVRFCCGIPIRCLGSEISRQPIGRGFDLSIHSKWQSIGLGKVVHSLADKRRAFTRESNQSIRRCALGSPTTQKRNRILMVSLTHSGVVFNSSKLTRHREIRKRRELLSVQFFNHLPRMKILFLTHINQCVQKSVPATSLI